MYSHYISNSFHILVLKVAKLWLRLLSAVLYINLSYCEQYIFTTHILWKSTQVK